jgi:eukaryotic translation initiation factor 2C
MGKILLNVSAATSAFYQPIFVSEYLQDSTTFNQNDRLRFLKGVQVYIEYQRGNHDAESRISGCNRPQARIKKVFEVGGQSINQQ